MVAISLSGSGEGLGRVIARGYSTASTQPPTPLAGHVLRLVLRRNNLLK